MLRVGVEWSRSGKGNAPWFRKTPPAGQVFSQWVWSSAEMLQKSLCAWTDPSTTLHPLGWSIPSGVGWFGNFLLWDSPCFLSFWREAPLLGFWLGFLGPFCVLIPWTIQRLWSEFWMSQLPVFDVGRTVFASCLHITVFPPNRGKIEVFLLIVFPPKDLFWARVVLSTWVTWSQGIFPVRIHLFQRFCLCLHLAGLFIYLFIKYCLYLHERGRGRRLPAVQGAWPRAQSRGRDPGRGQLPNQLSHLGASHFAVETPPPRYKSVKDLAQS